MKFICDICGTSMYTSKTDTSPICPVCNPAPETVKRRIILEYAKRIGYKVFVETGTNFGNMLIDMKDHFEELYSIELSHQLWKFCTERFKGEKKINLYFGNSGDILNYVIRYIERPCIFWLDAHYCGNFTAKADIETPILKELIHIFKHPLWEEHTILIDDAGDFIKGRKDYPSIEMIKEMAMKAGYVNCFVENNIIQITNGELKEVKQ